MNQPVPRCAVLQLSARIHQGPAAPELHRMPTIAALANITAVAPHPGPSVGRQRPSCRCSLLVVCKGKNGQANPEQEEGPTR